MYSLDVNFLKNREFNESLKVSPTRNITSVSWRKQAPLFIGLGVGATLIGLTALLGTMLNWQKAETEANIKQLDAEIGQLNARSQSLEEMEAKVKVINEEVTALVTVFNQIKPWSAVLQDIRRRTPSAVQIAGIEESTVSPEAGGTSTIQLKINGYARTYDDVNNFVLTLQSSEFFNAAQTRIDSAKQDSFPLELDEPAKANLEKQNIKVELPQAVQYTIITELSNIPASKLLPYLARDGAVGLVTRIKTLKQKGGIQP